MPIAASASACEGGKGGRAGVREESERRRRRGGPRSNACSPSTGRLRFSKKCALFVTLTPLELRIRYRECASKPVESLRKRIKTHGKSRVPNLEIFRIRKFKKSRFRRKMSGFRCSHLKKLLFRRNGATCIVAGPVCNVRARAGGAGRRGDGRAARDGRGAGVCDAVERRWVHDGEAVRGQVHARCPGLVQRRSGARRHGPDAAAPARPQRRARRRRRLDRRVRGRHGAPPTTPR